MEEKGELSKQRSTHLFPKPSTALISLYETPRLFTPESGLDGVEGGAGALENDIPISYALIRQI